MQEVRSGAYHAALLNLCGYDHACFLPHPNEDEGLAVWSRWPVEGRYLDGAMLACVDAPIGRVALVNVHLDWESALRRERQIVRAVDALRGTRAAMRLVLGDFNCGENSSVHGFLTGAQSLCGKAAVPCFYDLAEGWGFRHRVKPQDTLDVLGNPRWAGGAGMEISRRFDRILLQNPYPDDFPGLTGFGLWGNTIHPETGFAPSDHWGVWAEITQ